jgi:invasion protein IalB
MPGCRRSAEVVALLLLLLFASARPAGAADGAPAQPAATAKPASPPGQPPAVIVPLSPAQGPEPPPGAPPPERLAVFGDWKKMCEPAPDRAAQICFGFQKVSFNETKAQLLQAVVGYFRADRVDPTLIVTIPLGAFLLPGLEIRMKGQKPIHSDIQYCFSNGCQAAIRLDPGKLNLLKKAADAEVVFLDAGHQRISVPLSLKGFSAVLAALKPTAPGG